MPTPGNIGRGYQSPRPSLTLADVLSRLGLTFGGFDAEKPFVAPNADMAMPPAPPAQPGMAARAPAPRPSPSLTPRPATIAPPRAVAMTPPPPHGRPAPGMARPEMAQQQPPATLDINPSAGLTQPADPGYESDWGRGLLEFGLATLAAGGQPGASTAGALGQGGIAALHGGDARRDRFIATQAAGREEARDERKLDIEDRKALVDAQLAIATLNQRADDRSLDRELRAQMASDANELKRLSIEASAGNAQASLDLRTLMAEIAGQNSQTQADNAAADYRASLLKAQFGDFGMPAPRTPEEAQQQDAELAEIDAEVARAFPNSSIAGGLGMPAVPPAGGGNRIRYDANGNRIM